MRYLPLLAPLGCALVSCASVPETVVPDESIELSVDWRVCGSPTQAPYYSVDLLRDGTVRYRGRSGVHEKNERSTRIDPKQTARLAHSAMKIMRASPELVAPPPADQAHSEYCLSLKMDDGPATLSREVAPLSKLGKAFERQLQRSADLRPWVCPSRGEAEGMGDSARCPRPTINFTFSDKDSCGDFHVVDLYRDGQVHYYAHRMPESDRYYKIAPDVVDRLLEIGWKYQSTQEYTHVPANPTNKSIAGREMLIEYKQTLTRLAQVPWLTLSKWEECPEGLEYPQGKLWLDRK